MTIRIYDKIWVTRQPILEPDDGTRRIRKQIGEQKLAYMTNADNTAAFKKRQETGLNWSRNENKAGDFYDNTPMTGFKLGKAVSRWSTSNKYFRLEDPRGFEVEISTGNLEMLVRDVTIIKGVIQDECLWAREDGNVLVSVNSEPYTSSVVMNKDALAARPKMKDIKVGEEVVFENGDRGVYVGKFAFGIKIKIVTNNNPGGSWYDRDKNLSYQERIVTTDEMHFFREPKLNYKKQVCYVSYSTPKLLQNLGGNHDLGPLNKDCDWRTASGDYPGVNKTKIKLEDNQHIDYNKEIITVLKK